MSWQPLIHRFKGHTLEAQARAALMNRVDTKFLLPESQLAACFGGLTEHYTVLESGRERQFAYDTLYFDTPDRQLYRDHHNGKLNRRKVRVRRYLTSGDTYFEIKRKTNKGRTEKFRYRVDQSFQSEQLHSLIAAMSDIEHEVMGLPATRMLPALFVEYSRTTLMSRTGCERVTVDTNLSFRSASEQQIVTLPGLAILELKTESRIVESFLGQRLKALGHRSLAFSKYCIGTALLSPKQVKTNRFKPVLNCIGDAVSTFKESSWNRPSIPISSFA